MMRGDPVRPCLAVVGPTKTMSIYTDTPRVPVCSLRLFRPSLLSTPPVAVSHRKEEGRILAFVGKLCSDKEKLRPWVNCDTRRTAARPHSPDSHSVLPTWRLAALLLRLFPPTGLRRLIYSCPHLPCSLKTLRPSHIPPPSSSY
ncbi:unnamed protein product [Victoria cruziana]